MSFAAPHRATEPCDHYSGNVCTGFGAAAVCMACGWERHEHPEDQERVRRIFEEAASSG